MAAVGDTRSPRSRASLLIATGLGVGYVPRIPGTAGSVVGMFLFALLDSTLGEVALRFAFLVTLAWLVPLSFWSTRQALPQWNTPDPQPIVIDEVAGQFLTYWPLLWIPPSVSELSGWAAWLPGWKSLLVGFILFRGFDVGKPFPIRRLERLRGAAGVVVDDLVAGLYAGLCLGLLSRTGWLG